MPSSEVCGALESTLLSPTARSRDVENLCREAVEAGFHGVCVPPSWVGLAVGLLRDTGVRVVSVAGFPLGYQSTRSKVAEVADLVEAGAHEVDVVMNLGWFLDGRLRAVARELQDIRRASEGRVLKVILETGALAPEQVREAAAVALGAGADFLKTCTGYGPRGVTIRDVRLLRQVAGGRCGIKASGGIRTLDQALGLLAAGADRLGTSSAGAIWAEARGRAAGAPRA